MHTKANSKVIIYSETLKQEILASTPEDERETVVKEWENYICHLVSKMTDAGFKVAILDAQEPKVWEWASKAEADPWVNSGAVTFWSWKG